MRKAQRKVDSGRVKTPVKNRPKGDESHYSKASCDMVRVANRQAVHDGPPGAFWLDLEQEPRVMWHKLPNGSVGFLQLRPMPAGDDPHPSWDFDGNEDRPTLSPSVHYLGGWHGWFRKGRMVSV